MADTAAVLEAPGAVTDPGAELPADDQPELTPPDVPDQLDIETPESGEDDDPYAGLTSAEIAAKVREEAKAEAAQEAEAGKAEALRRQRESLLDEQRQNAAIAAADAKLRADQDKASVQFVASAAKRLRQAADGEIDMDDDAITSEFRSIYDGASLVAFDQLPQAADVELKRMGFTNGINALEGDFKAEFFKARAERNYGGAIQALFGFARQKQHEASIAWYEAQQATRADATAQEQAAAKQVQKTRRDAAGAVQPTNGRGNAAGQVNNRTILDTAHPGSAEYARAFKAEHGFDPPTP